MSDIRETFELTVRAAWGDNYSFIRDTDEHYCNDVLDGMWWAWQAALAQGRQGAGMSDTRAEFERVMTDQAVLIWSESMGKYHSVMTQNMWEVWQYARAQSDQSAELIALLRREIGESSWFDHTPVRPNTAEAEELKVSTEMDYCKVYTHPPKAQAVPEGWKPVPERASEAMLDAGRLARVPGLITCRDAATVWHAMLEAAPKQEQPND